MSQFAQGIFVGISITLGVMFLFLIYAIVKFRKDK